MSDNNFSDVPTELVDWDPQIISLNTNGFSNSHRYILDKLSSVHDVSFIQETRFRTPSLHDRVAFHWQRITNHEGSLFFEEPIYPEVSTSPATGGLATLIHPHSPLKNATQVPHDKPVLRGRYLQVRCTLGPLTVVLHNIYAPAAFQERASYFEELPRDFPPHALHIVGGDFNCTLNKDLDSLRPSTSTMAGTLQLEQWMHSLSLVDLFRRQNPVARAFTSPTLTNRLDYIFCSSTLAGLRHWKATHMPHVPQADHVACRIISKRQTLRHGSGSWKAPTWLLRLPRAAEIVHGCLDRFLDKSPTFHNISKAYDMLVNDIRSQLKEFHSQRLEKQRLPLKKLAVEIASLLQVPNMRQDSVLVDRVRDLQKQIHELQDRDKQFRQDQAFQLHLYKAERSSKFHFMSPVPTPLKKTVFKELVDVNGNVVSNQQGMSDVLVDYYKDLFAAPEVQRSGDEVSSFLTPLTRHKQLPEQAQKELSAPLRANEFYHAIRHSSSNSAPGPNALPFEVLKLAPHKWSLVLELLFTHQLHSHPRLTPMQLVSTLVLLHKKGPKSQAKNYRPISLLNTDVKILTSILAYRLQRHIRHIIHPDQQGFIRRSNIQTNIANFRICLVPLKSRSYQVPPRSKCPTPTAVPSSVRPTLTESPSFQDGGSGVSNVSTPNPRAEVEVEFDPNSVSGDQSASRSTSASPGAPLAGVPGGVNLSGSVVDPQTTVVNLSSEALTQEGEPLGPCACGGCFPGLQLESIPSEGGEKTGSMPALEATRAPPMGTPCGSVYFPPGASSEGRGRYPDLGSRRSNGVPQSPCCGDGMDSPSTPVTGGLAPAFLVTNGTEPAATNRVAPCAEPPRTGEEEEKSQEDVDMVSGDAEGKDSTETEALTDEGNTQIHSEVDGSGDINGQAKPCDTPGEVIQEEQSTNNDNDQSNQDIVDKSVAQGNGAVDPPTAADKIQGDQEQQNAEKANPWTQKTPGKDSASSKKDSKQGNAPKGAKHRNTGAHAIADDDIARCEAMADTFYKDSGDMDAFIENILLTPQSQVYELTVKLGEAYKDWSEKVICDQFVKENPGSLWGSKFPNILIHKKNPHTIVISSYNLSTCVEMGGTTFRLGGKDFLVPKYSRYGNNYYVTFNKVSHPSMAKAIVKKMAALTKSVIAAFNPTAGQNIKSPHLRVIFKSPAPPAVLVPKSGDALREITITDPSGQPFVVVFQHKIAALNKTLPPSIVSRRAEAKAEKAKAKVAKAEKAKAKVAKAAAKSPPSGEKEPEHDGDDHDQDPGTNAEGEADSTEASGDGQDEQPQPTAPSHGSDVDMSGDSDPPNNNGQDKQQEDVEMSTNESPALAPPSEQPKNSLDLQLVTGYRSGPAPKRTLPSSPRLDPLPTSNRFHILEEDDVELSFEDFAVPRIVLEDSSAPRPKKTKGKAKKQRLNKSAAAHLELAKKIIRDKKVEGSITECQRILRDDPQLVAHAMYAQDEDLSLFQSLVATKTIERKMALLKAQGKPHNYKHHVNFMAQYKIHPSEILEELTTDIPEIKRILFALATIDLFLSNRAPDLYTNSEALTVLLNQEATRLPDTNCLTDWSLFALIENFSDNLEKFTLPAPVLSAISMLKSITNNYHIDELCSKAHHSMNADEIDPLDLEDDQL
ncbi:hypothetical protein AC1031_013290 [Aphanomyces cochlioides]|nr:hypothetical protein AC1031_013290 [Aphanomyces cochlioides]